MPEPKHLLVVEDDRDVQELVAQALRDEGYSVDIAANGTEAFNAAHKRRPDLVILDMMLPDLDGVQVGTRLKEACGGDLRILVLSAIGGFADVFGESLGAYESLHKPFELQELLAAVHRGLGSAA